jgi:hypothetical protein
VDILNNAARFPTQELWRQVALDAADLGFTLFMVDSSGVRTSSSTDAEAGVTSQVAEKLYSGPFVGPADQAVRESANPVDSAELTAQEPNAGNTALGQWLERTRKDLLISASELTGGKAHFQGDPGTAISEVSASLAHYYSLAFTTEHVGDGQVYNIDVKLPGHPTYELIHRTAYLDQRASTREAQQVRADMLFGIHANPLDIQVEFGEADGRFHLGAAGSKRVRVPVVVKIPFAHVDMIPRGDVHWGKVLITFFSEDRTGNQSQIARHEQPLTVSSARYEEAVSRGYFSYKTTVEVEGGRQRVFVGVKDTVGGQTSVVPHLFEF